MEAKGTYDTIFLIYHLIFIYYIIWYTDRGAEVRYVKVIDFFFFIHKKLFLIEIRSIT